MIKYENVGYNQNISLDTVDMPLYFYLELNNSCNLRCKFCSVSNKNNEYISIDMARYILDELKNNGIYDVYYTGGEPLLHPNFMEIVEYADKLGIRQTILTNGILLDKIQPVLNKIMCVCVSLHGTKEIHNKLTDSNCYDKVLSNIELTKKITNVKINYTVTSDNQNIKEMKDVLEFGNKKNIPISFSKYNNIGEGKKNKCYININSFVENLNILRNEGYNFSINDCIAPCIIEEKYTYLTHGCGAGYLFGSIDYNGNLKICPSSKRIIGNIKVNNIKKIWNQTSLKNFRKMEWIPEYCKVCKNLARCRCGCKIELGKKLNEINDYIVKTEIEKIWNRIREKNMKVNISVLRKEKKDYVSLSYPSRKYNVEAVKILEKINNEQRLEQFAEYKDFLVALYRDGVLKEVDYNVEKENRR